MSETPPGLPFPILNQIRRLAIAVSIVEPLTTFQRSLAEAMSAISEARWYAGWLSGLEFTLWECLQDAGVNFLTIEETHNLRNLSEACGGWIVWDDDHWDVNEGYRFVATEEWVKTYEAWRVPA